MCLFWSLCPLCTMNVQWTYIVRDVSITSTILIKRLLCSMDVQCVYCVHCVHYTYYAHWMPPTKTQPSTNRCKAGVSIVDNKMDTMDIDFVHWTCPLVTKNEHTVSIVSIGDQWTFSTFWYVANGRINGRPLNVHWTWSLYTMWRMYTMGTPNRSCCTFTQIRCVAHIGVFSMKFSAPYLLRNVQNHKRLIFLGQFWVAKKSTFVSSDLAMELESVFI